MAGILVHAHIAARYERQLIQDGRVLQRAGVLGDGFALGDAAQQAAHDLAAAGLGQVVAEADVLGLGDGADLLGHPVAQLVGDLLGFVAGGARALEHHEGADGLAGGVVGAAHHGGFGHQVGVADQGDSISIVPMRWPDTFSTSSMRPVMVK
jgi:hypothetical protein